MTSYDLRLGRGWSLRLVLPHLTHEYTRHTGHADFLRDGGTGA